MEYNRSLFEAAYAKYQRAPHTLMDADIAALDAFDPAVADRAIDARHTALLAKVPHDSPIVTKAAEPSRTTRRRDDAAIADVIVATVKRAIAPLSERVAVLETENRMLRDRVVTLEADRAVREEPDRVPR